MALQGISDFKTNFHGGARNNLFEVTMEASRGATPGPNVADKQMSFLVKVTTFPASTVAPLEVPFRGRVLKLAGQRTFEEWTVTVINDADFKIRENFEKWSAGMSYHDVNSSAYSGQGNFANYMVDANVTQLNHGKGSHDPGYTYTFKDLWPSSIGAIDLAMEGEAIQEYQVTFQYQYWFSGQSTGDATTGQKATRGQE